MLPFFPSSYQDELLYSVLARYHVWSRNHSYKDTMKDLYGSGAACAVMDLPSRLSDLCANLHKDSLITPECIIQESTLFPLFRPFLPKERIEKIVDAMMGNSKGGSIHTTTGIMASSITSPRFLRFCQRCLESEEELLGEPYWHRTHQVFGVTVCPIHEVALVETRAAVSSPQNKHFYIALCKDLAKKQKQNPLLMIEGCKAYYVSIAKAVHWLLINKIPAHDLIDLQNRYIYFLRKKDFATYRGRVNQKDLIAAFLGFYGRDFLTQFESNINDFEPDNWLSKLVRKPRTATHPVRHILLILFLGLTLEEFFLRHEKIQNLPFGKGPWPCLNKAASHYRSNIIRDCIISRDSKNGLPVGTFSCECGFIYSRRGPDKKGSDLYKIGRIKSFGPEWQKELLYLATQEKISLRGIAKSLNVDTKTIKFQLERLAKQGRGAASQVTPEDRYDKKLKQYRTSWKKVIENHPGKIKTEIRKLMPCTYIWLYRHDRQWLDQNSPPLKARTKHADYRVDWDKRDKELVKRVKHAAGDIKKACKPIRVTISSIGKQVGEIALLQRHLLKLPRTKIALGSLVETEEDFQIRRVKWAAKILSEKGELLQEWKIVRMAGLRPGYSERVRKEIYKVLL